MIDYLYHVWFEVGKCDLTPFQEGVIVASVAMPMLVILGVVVFLMLRFDLL